MKYSFSKKYNKMKKKKYNSAGAVQNPVKGKNQCPLRNIYMNAHFPVRYRQLNEKWQR
jgi:hypothetical protein